MPEKPVLLMAFAANDLPEVNTEAEQTWQFVAEHPSIQAIKLEDAEIAELADALIDHHQNLSFFHFAGHASAQDVVLEGDTKLDKYQLSRLLTSGTSQPLQWAFLNGCESYGHVGILTASGVKAVIATSIEVSSKQAAQLARFFYKCFFQKQFTLKAAFERATATLPGVLSQTLITNPGEINDATPLSANWALYIHSKHQEVLNWTLEQFIQSTKNQPGTTTNPGNSNVIQVTGSDNIIISGVSGSNLNLNTFSSPPTLPKTDRGTILDHLNNDDLQGAFDLLDLVDFGNFRGNYIQLKNEFIDMPVGGNRTNLRDRLSVFVKMRLR